MLTVKNTSNDLVIVGETYLFSGAQRQCRDAVARAAVAANPGKLVILEEIQVEPVEPLESVEDLKPIEEVEEVPAAKRKSSKVL